MRSQPAEVSALEEATPTRISTARDHDTTRKNQRMSFAAAAILAAPGSTSRKAGGAFTLAGEAAACNNPRIRDALAT